MSIPFSYDGDVLPPHTVLHYGQYENIKPAWERRFGYHL
jgi:hypothetical protein